MHVGDHHQAARPRSRHKVLEQPRANLVGEVVEKSRAIHEVEDTLIQAVFALGRSLEQLVHRLLDVLDLHLLATLPGRAINAGPRVFQRGFTEVQKGEGQALGVGIRGNEALDFNGRTASDVEHARLATRPFCIGGHTTQVFNEDVDPVAVRLRHRRLQEEGVDDLKVGAVALARIGQDLVHHLVVARVTEWLRKGAVHEGRAQKQRVQRRLRKVAVRNGIFLRDPRTLLLQPHEILRALLHDGFGKLVEDIGPQTSICLTGQDRGHVCLIRPTRGLGEKSTEFADRDLVALFDFEARFPIGDKAHGLVVHLAHITADRIEVRPLVDEGHRHHGHQAGVEQAHHHRLALVEIAVAGADGQFVEYLADLHDGVRVVDLHHQRAALQAGQGPAGALALAVAECDDVIEWALKVHGRTG